MPKANAIPTPHLGFEKNPSARALGAFAFVRGRIPLGHAWLGAVCILLTVIWSAQAQNTANTWNGTTTGSLRTASNWSLGAIPTVTNDAVFSSAVAGGIRTLTAGDLTVGSFNLTASTGTYSIRNNTSGSTNSTLTLGGSGNLGNGVSGTSTDLLYAATGSTFNIRGDNGGGGTGTLFLALGQNGTFNIAGTSDISATITGAGFGFTKTGAGNLTLSGNNTHTGITTVSSGTLRLNSTNALQSSTLDTGASGSQIVNFIVAGTNTYNLGGLAGSDNLSLGANTISVGSNNQTTTFSGNISSTGGGLTKTGSGSLILTGANTYSGATAVSEGTLRVNGTHVSAITVSSSASLGGNGTISGLVTLNSGANLTPGNGVGNLNFNGGLTLNSTSTVTMEINGASAFDTVNVSSGSLNYAGTLSLVLGYTPAVNATYQLFTGASLASATGNFATLNFNNPEYQGTYDSTSGVLTVTAIPEPQTWALLALGALTLLGMNRKKLTLRFPNHAASQAVPNPNPIIPQS